MTPHGYYCKQHYPIKSLRKRRNLKKKVESRVCLCKACEELHTCYYYHPRDWDEEK